LQDGLLYQQRAQPQRLTFPAHFLRLPLNGEDSLIPLLSEEHSAAPSTCGHGCGVTLKAGFGGENRRDYVTECDDYDCSDEK
jgi:hypothetical protein